MDSRTRHRMHVASVLLEFSRLLHRNANGLSLDQLFHIGTATYTDKPGMVLVPKLILARDQVIGFIIDSS